MSVHHDRVVSPDKSPYTSTKQWLKWVPRTEFAHTIADQSIHESEEVSGRWRQEPGNTELVSLPRLLESAMSMLAVDLFEAFGVGIERSTCTFITSMVCLFEHDYSSLHCKVYSAAVIVSAGMHKVPWDSFEE